MYRLHNLRLGNAALIIISILPLIASAQPSIEAETSLAESVQINRQVNEAYEMFAKGEADTALAMFQAALGQDSDDLSAQLGAAMILADKQLHNDAYHAYDLIVQKQPRHAFAWNGRGLAAYNLEDFDEALRSFAAATAEKPVDGFFYENLAWTQLCRGEFSDAAISAKHATLMYNKNSEVTAYPLLIAYFAYLELGDTTNADRTLRYAVLNKPVSRWPSPIIDYLSGSIDEGELISFVTSTTEETEVHTYIGLNNRMSQNIAKAKKHFDWVSHKGDSRVFEYTLCRALSLQDSVAQLAPQQ